MRRSRSALLCLVCAVVLWGKSTEINGQTDGNATLRLLSFNTYLAAPRETSFYSGERRAALLDQLADTSSPLNQADAICLQEVQYENDIKSVQQKAEASGFVYAYSFVDAVTVNAETLAGGLAPACSPLSMGSLQPCLQTTCGEVFATYQIRLVVSCVSSNCSTELQQAGLTSECLSCLTNLGLAGLTNCSYPQNTKRLHRPTYGLVLLSKHPLYSARAVAFDVPVPSIYSRGYLEAELRSTNGAGNWKVICTHLYPRINGAQYSGAYDSDVEENLNNTGAVLKAAKGSDNVVLMGDMNHGPGVAATGVEPLFTDNYKHVLRENFCAPYANNMQLPNCTYCASNPLNFNDVVKETNIVDHIYLRYRGNQCPSATARRVLTAQSVVTARPPGRVPLSDHYGVEVTITVPKVQGQSSGAGRDFLDGLPIVLMLLLMHLFKELYLNFM